MNNFLSEGQLQQYEAEGYCYPFDILGDKELANYLSKLDNYEAETGHAISGIYRHKPHLIFPWLHDLISNPLIVDAIEDVLGPNILCWGSNFFNKDAGDPSFVSWHQDANYWGLDRPDVCSAWIALTPSNSLSGCMRVIPGSHKKSLSHIDTYHEHNLLSRGQEIDDGVDEAKAVDLELLPGQMSLHHVGIVHGSNPNRSNERRLGFAIRYINSGVRQTLGPRDFATLVRGEVTHNDWELEPRPKSELDPAAVAYHARVCEIQLKMFFAGAAIQPFDDRVH
tara:strand:+ start:2026 stop:2868 length:843 start_codon:yes stop_codon:yes gene_type:complete